MAETNGGGRLDDHEARLSKLEAARAEIEDALTVMAHLETRSSAQTKAHAEFIAEHQAMIREHRSQILEDRAARKDLEKRVDDVVSAIGKLISRIPPSALA